MLTTSLNVINILVLLFISYVIYNAEVKEEDFYKDLGSNYVTKQELEKVKKELQEK